MTCSAGRRYPGLGGQSRREVELGTKQRPKEQRGATTALCCQLCSEAFLQPQGFILWHLFGGVREPTKLLNPEPDHLSQPCLLGPQQLLEVSRTDVPALKMPEMDCGTCCPHSTTERWPVGFGISMLKSLGIALMKGNVLESPLFTKYSSRSPFPMWCVIGTAVDSNEEVS